MRRSRRCGGKRQLDKECRADSLTRFDPDRPPHPSDQLAADVEAETGAGDCDAHVREAVESLEDPLLLGLRNANALVADGYAKAGPPRFESDLDTAGATRILDCVGHEVRENLLELVAVRGDRGQSGKCSELERELIGGMHARGLDDPVCDGRDVDWLAREGRSSGLELAREKDIADKTREPLGLMRDDGEELVAQIIAEDDVFAFAGLRRPVDSGDRSSQLMRDGGDEIRLELLQSPLLRQIAECVNGSLRKANSGDREPELTTSDFDGKRRRGTSRRSGSARGRDGSCECLPARDRFLDSAAQHLRGQNTCDRLGGRVPELNSRLGVDKKDAVGDVAE